MPSGDEVNDHQRSETDKPTWRYGTVTGVAVAASAVLWWPVEAYIGRGLPSSG